MLCCLLKCQTIPLIDFPTKITKNIQFRNRFLFQYLKLKYEKMDESIFDSGIKYKIPSNKTRRNRSLFHGLKKNRRELIKKWFQRVQSHISHCEFEKLTEILLIDKFFCELNDEEIKSFQGTDTWTLNQLNEYFSCRNIHFECANEAPNGNDGNQFDDDQPFPFPAIEYEDVSIIEHLL